MGAEQAVELFYTEDIKQADNPKDFLVEHHYRDAILSTILGGTTEMHKLTIGRQLLGINAMV